MKEREPIQRGKILTDTLRNCFLYVDLIDNSIDQINEYPLLTRFDNGQVSQIQSDSEVYNMLISIGIATMKNMINEGYNEELEEFRDWKI